MSTDVESRRRRLHKILAMKLALKRTSNHPFYSKELLQIFLQKLILFCFLLSSGHSRCTDDVWQEASIRTTIRAENEFEAHKLANNYKFGFRKWKSHVTERPIEDRSDVVKELYSELNYIKHHSGSLITAGNVIYVLLFGWWISIFYFLVSLLMFCTIAGIPYGKLCLQLSGYFLWPFGKALQKSSSLLRKCCVKFPHCEAIPEEVDEVKESSEVKESTPLLRSQMVSTITRVLLCCYRAFNWYYYKYTVDGINVFAVNLLPLVIFTLVIGYVDRDNYYVSSEAKFAIALSSIIPLSYYIGMGIASISAQSNFAVGAVVNATFGSITEMAFYITALLQGHRAGNKCYAEIVKSALTGTLLGCILFIPGICMIIGGCKHSEQRFNSRSAGVSSALLFISVGGVFTPTLFSKAYGNFICEGCNISLSNTTKPFICNNCHYDLSENNRPLFLSHIEPLVYTISVLLPAAYLIGLIFTLKTHSHIYDLHISDAHCHGADHGAVVHWSRARALVVLILATVLMAACADLSTEHIKPIISNSSVSQYFIGVTILAMVPELPEIVNGIQFALQNNISLSLEVGSCIAVQVCMLQIPLLIFFNAFYDVGFVLIFSDLHLWASIFSVILVNYIFMDGKSDYFQGTALVVVYLILLALYFFAPAPLGC
uniref:Low affinity vacuolar monovalent cation/H(+) antiporter-like n=1 Tax=Sinocyclocheilus rhinocerous TaxID=307959 RepID=A0A673JRX0_9TELE